MSHVGVDKIGDFAHRVRFRDSVEYESWDATYAQDESETESALGRERVREVGESMTCSHAISPGVVGLGNLAGTGEGSKLDWID